jgi:hypothetical protein
MTAENQATTKSQAGDRKTDLAELISAVLNHPDVPGDLYNAIGDWLNDSFHDGLSLSETWFVRRALERAAGAGVAAAGAEEGSHAEQAETPENGDILTPEQAAAIVGGWDTNGDEHTGDLLLLCRALALSDRRRAEDILTAIEKEKVLISPSVNDALDALIEQRRRAAQKGVQR